MNGLKGKSSQIFVAIVANIIGIVWGATIGWSSPVLANLMDHNYWPNSPLKHAPSPNQQSYIGCLLPFGGFIGPLIAAPLISRIGRKYTLLLSSVFFIASYIILMVTKGISAMYLARFIQGVGDGIAMVLLPIYVGEISSPECRLVLLTMTIILVMAIILMLKFFLKNFSGEF